jgi:hypothetical protein
MIDSIIIGAGVCGLALSRELSKKENVLIIEKSKGVGGRVATRRIEEQGFDHGALYLPATPSIMDLLDSFNLPFQIKDNNLFIFGGMNQLAKKMAEGLNILKNKRITKISYNQFWDLTTEEGDQFQAKKIILTAPMPQALELLDANLMKYPSELKNITYSKGLLLLGIADEVKLLNSSHQLNSMKERSLHPKGFVLRASEAFSDEHFEQTEDSIKSLLSELIEVKNLTHSEVKKWRYVQSLKTIEMPYLDLGHQFFLAGDSFISPNIGGALRSASSLFRHLYP